MGSSWNTGERGASRQEEIVSNPADLGPAFDDFWMKPIGVLVGLSTAQCYAFVVRLRRFADKVLSLVWGRR